MCNLSHTLSTIGPRHQFFITKYLLTCYAGLHRLTVFFFIYLNLKKTTPTSFFEPIFDL